MNCSAVKEIPQFHISFLFVWENTTAAQENLQEKLQYLNFVNFTCD